MLLVEDDVIDRMAFERHVKSQGLPYDYLTADSIARAKELLGSESFDVILLDYNLGDGTALDIIELEPEAPIVIITGSDQIDLAVAAMKAGAYDYLVKDLERDYLQVLPFAVDGAIRAKKAEDEFRVLSHAVMSAADSIFITDLDGNVTFINRAATGTYGYEEPDIVGKNISVIGETGGEGEFVHLRKDGSEFPVSAARSLVQDEAGRSIAYVLMVRDITEQKRAEEQLKRINEELEGYAHTVSHDLKGPFTGMLLGISAVRELMYEQGVSGQDMEQSLDVIKNSALKSVALIDDLLELAEAGQQPAEVEEVDVSSVVERIVQENAAEIEARGAEVMASGPLGEVRASPAHVYQLFANLIRNCVKH